jgi:hypothetical protein
LRLISLGLKARWFSNSSGMAVALIHKMNGGSSKISLPEGRRNNENSKQCAFYDRRGNLICLAGARRLVSR